MTAQRAMASAATLAIGSDETIAPAVYLTGSYAKQTVAPGGGSADKQCPTADPGQSAALHWRTRAVWEAIALRGPRISKPELVRCTGLSLREVDARVRELVQLELVAIELEAHGRRAHTYRVTRSPWDPVEERRKWRRARAWSPELADVLARAPEGSPCATVLRIVLRALLWHANGEHDGDAWPALTTIVRACWGLSRSTVLAALRVLELLELQAPRLAGSTYPNGAEAPPCAVVRRVPVRGLPSASSSASTPAHGGPLTPAHGGPEPPQAADLTPAHGGPKGTQERVHERESAGAHARESAADVVRAYSVRWFSRSVDSRGLRDAISERLAEGWTSAALIRASTDGLAAHPWWGDERDTTRRHPLKIFGDGALLAAFEQLACASTPPDMLAAPVFSGSSSDAPALTSEQRAELAAKVAATRQRGFTRGDF